MKKSYCCLTIIILTFFSCSEQYYSIDDFDKIVMIDDPKFDPIFNALADRDIPLIGHLGSLEWNVNELAKRLDQFPNMAVDMAARMGQLYYQTRENRDRVRSFFLEYQDRILYGTDLGDNGMGRIEDLQKRVHTTWLDDWKYLTTDELLTSRLIDGEFQGLKLPREIVNKIYRKNAETWLNGF